MLAAVAAAIVLLATDTPAASAAPPPFNPGGIICFENLETAPECDGDSSPGAAADLRIKFCLGWGADCSTSPLGNISAVDDSIYRLLVFFAPPQWSAPISTSAPIGALVGRASAVQTLGVLSNPCSNSFFPISPSSTAASPRVRP